MQTGSRISPGKIRFPPIFLLENRSVIIHSFPRARTPIRGHGKGTQAWTGATHTHIRVLVRYTWSGVPKALPLDRVQNQRTCYFCNLFTLGYRSDGRVAGGTQADAIYGRGKNEGKGRDLLTLATLARFFNSIRSIAKILFPSCGIVCYLNFLLYSVIKIHLFVIKRLRKRRRILFSEWTKRKFRLFDNQMVQFLSRWRVRNGSNLNICWNMFDWTIF